MNKATSVLNNPVFQTMATLSGAIALVLLLMVPGRPVGTWMYKEGWPIVALLLLMILLVLLVRTKITQGRRKVVRGHLEVRQELEATIRTAENELIALGSRSRDKEHLALIEQQLGDVPDLGHIRILCGPPVHSVFSNHLDRLMQIGRTARISDKARIGYCALGDQPEVFIVANESRATIIMPSLGDFDKYDACFVTTDKQDVRETLLYGKALLGNSSRIKTMNELASLIGIPTQSKAP